MCSELADCFDLHELLVSLLYFPFMHVLAMLVNLFLYKYEIYIWVFLEKCLLHWFSISREENEKDLFHEAVLSRAFKHVGF
jgi:hypothetical protein